MRFAALAALAAAALCLAAPAAAQEEGRLQACLDCHAAETPQIVEDWKLSAHRGAGTDCTTCHGTQHTTAQDAGQAKLARPYTCAQCHAEQVDRFKAGKHAKAWVAMNAMPTIHWQPQVMIAGREGCGGCHQIGIKDEKTLERLRREEGGFGMASCDACHTRHLFSADEARQPQACRTCHMGMDHPQWEMYSSSKHGVRSKLKQLGALPQKAAAPTCQRCHMTGGDHAVGTAWGFLAVRLPLPDDEQWAADQTTILKGLGVLSPEGEPTERLKAVKAADVARLTQKAWQEKRDAMLAVCSDCHSERMARRELAKGDEMIREADHLMAQAIRVVAGLYQDGLLRKPKGYAQAYPDLLAFHDAPTVIEQKLFIMFLKHRMRAFQGSFHQNPDYSLWYGWSEMVRDLTEIKARARELRQAQAEGSAKP
jgi:hypothetical protein